MLADQDLNLFLPSKVRQKHEQVGERSPQTSNWHRAESANVQPSSVTWSMLTQRRRQWSPERGRQASRPRWQPNSQNPDRRVMPARIRHCVQCPKCFTRYLFSRSPYRNGSYLIPTVPHSSDEYALYCSCRRPAVP